LCLVATDFCVIFYALLFVFFFFFFSSRRRHTRLVSDWSSDVCSSDLGLPVRVLPGSAPTARGGCRVEARLRLQFSTIRNQPVTRSEERRVGKECRSRWWADQ